MTDLITPTGELDTVEDDKTEEGDHDLFTHIVLVRKGSPITAKALVLQARVEGFPIAALCGKQWVPTRDDSKYEVCPTCIEVWEALAGKKFPGRA